MARKVGKTQNISVCMSMCMYSTSSLYFIMYTCFMHIIIIIIILSNRTYITLVLCMHPNRMYIGLPTCNRLDHEPIKFA